MDVHETNGGGDFDGRSRIRRHVKSVLDGDSFSELALFYCVGLIQYCEGVIPSL